MLKSLLFAGVGDQSNFSYSAKQRVKPTFNRVQQAIKAANCPQIASFESFTGYATQKNTKKCNEQPA